jgi:hypothetical protein
MKELKGLTKLHTLGIWGPQQINDETLQVLHAVHLLHTWIGARAEGGERPKRPEDVIALYLSLSGITDAGLKELKEFGNLKELEIAGTNIDDQGLKQLKDFKHLEHLQLFDTQITDGGLKYLKEMKQLRRVVLPEKSVTDDAAKELAEALPDLEVRRDFRGRVRP